MALNGTMNKILNSDNFNDCKCIKYDNFSSVNFNLAILENNFHAYLIPVCKYTPTMFHKYILNYKFNNKLNNKLNNTIFSKK